MSSAGTGYRLTYATMFDPPPSLHQRFDAALGQLRPQLGADHAMHIGGQPRHGERWFELRSPIDRELLLGRFALGRAADVDDAVAAARAAAPGWAATPYAQRIERLRRAAALIEERVFELAAAVALEVGKNR
nr:aldehyde dehydrogenase family protein [Burkholderiaceae bacterium]